MRFVTVFILAVMVSHSSLSEDTGCNFYNKVIYGNGGNCSGHQQDLDVRSQGCSERKWNFTLAVASTMPMSNCPSGTPAGFFCTPATCFAGECANLPQGNTVTVCEYQDLPAENCAGMPDFYNCKVRPECVWDQTNNMPGVCKLANKYMCEKSGATIIIPHTAGNSSIQIPPGTTNINFIYYGHSNGSNGLAAYAGRLRYLAGLPNITSVNGTNYGCSTFENASSTFDQISLVGENANHCSRIVVTGNQLCAYAQAQYDWSNNLISYSWPLASPTTHYLQSLGDYNYYDGISY